VNVLCKYFICSDELDNNEDWCIFIGAEKEDCNEAVQSCPDCPRMYAGKMLDGHSNVIDLDEGQGKIGNSQQRFVTHSAFISMKHGYLGKSQHTRLPHCAESGIHCNFPDTSDSSIGFCLP
jgi:hypothetical protein